jgi:hypothetical protein
VTVRKVVLGLVLGVAFVVLSLGVVTWMRSSGDPVRVVSREGGFSLAVPKGWSVEQRRPTTDEHRDFLVGHENAALGFLQRGGFWVARWSVGADASTDTVRARMRADQTKSPRDNWTVETQRLGGRDAVVMRFTESPDFAGRLRLGNKRVVIYEMIDGRFNYQVGLWTLPRPGSAKNALERIAASIELFTPRAWTAELGDTDARLKLPGGWAQFPSDLKGVVLFALAPGDPTDAWAYVFHYEDSPAASLRTARRSISGSGGAITGQYDSTLGDRKAVRLDFTFPDGDRPPARDTEWFVSDGDGGTFVLAVGVRSGDPNIADRIASGWTN